MAMMGMVKIIEKTGTFSETGGLIGKQRMHPL